MLIVITGASRGIGFETVKLFCTNSDHHVVAVSRTTGTLKKLQRDQSLKNLSIVKADITKAKSRKTIHQTITSLKQPVDIILNNAGAIVNKPFEKISDKELAGVYATNVFGPFLLIQSLLGLMNKKGSPHIVNISSMGGFQGSVKFPGLSAYSSSKAAIAGLSECLAVELAAKKITVNCLAIGAVQTEMLASAFPGYKAPLQPNEMAAFIHDFATNGQKYFNGKVIPVSSSTP